MDYIRFHCTFCNHLLVVPPEAAGMSGPCPNCHSIIQGPNQPAAPPQPQPLNPPQEAVITLPVPQASPAPVSPPMAKPPPAAAEPTPPQHPAPQPTQELSPPSPEAAAPLPEPEPDQPPPTPQPKYPRSPSLSLPQTFVLCFLSSLIFFALGFFLGKSGAVDWEEIVRESERQKAAQHTAEQIGNTDSPTEHSDPQITITPLETSPPIEKAKLTTASATLEAFLAADTWGARSAYVLNSQSVLSMMAANAAVHGDGPISFKRITLEHEEPSVRAFGIETEKHPFPFTVMMIKEGDWWLVDWPAFADFYYDRLGSFASGNEGPMKGIFRVQLKAAPGETSPLSPSRCLVSAPQSSSSHQVNSVAESPARRKLAEIFQAYLQAEPKRFKEVMAGDGIPLTVKISRSGALNPTLQLDQVISTGWPPLSPENFEKEPSSRFY